MAINGFQITPQLLQQLQAYIGSQNNQLNVAAPPDTQELLPIKQPDMSQLPVGQENAQSNPMEALGSTNWTGALIGAGAGIVNELLGGEDEMVKQKQAWLDEMENRNRANNETIRATNSESNRRGAMLGLNQAKAGAMAQAANIGAGQALGSGLGGDVSSQQIAGVKAAAPVLSAAGQFGQAEAGLMAQKAQEDAQRNQALIQNQQAGTDIESQRLYLNKQKGSNWLNAIAGGTGIWKNIVDSMSKSTGTHT